MTGSKDRTCIVWSLTAAKAHSPSANVGSNSSTTSTAAMMGMHTMNLQNVQTTNTIGVHSNTNNNLTPKPLHTLYGHDDAVSCVSIMTELDIVVSGSRVRVDCNLFYYLNHFDFLH